MEVLFHLLGVREGDSIDALQRVVGGLAEPVSRGVLCDFERLHHIRVRDVRTSAQVDQSAASVGCHLTAIRDLVADQLHLEWVGGEETEAFLFGEHQSLKGLFLSKDLLGSFLDLVVVLIREDVLASVRVVVEAIGSRRSNAELDSKLVLQSLAQDVSRGMPEALLA